jgi:alcohol dehydrogenase
VKLFKRWMHALYVRISVVMIKLVPDKMPVTFTGPGSSHLLCKSIAQSGMRRTLVVTDAMLVEIGLIGPIVSVLNEAGVECVVFSGVQPDPTFVQIDEGLAQYNNENCDSVLAVGGGSSMDAAKVIAAAAANPGPVRKLEGMMKLKQSPVPLFAIPTTAGTGSEVTLAAVISESDTHAKRFFIDPKLLPRMAALDPNLMVGLPKAITAATGMDALTHAIESYLSKTSTPATEAYAEIAVRLIFRNLPIAYAEGENLDARESMALASYYGGLAFTRTGVGYVHAIAHTFGAYYGTPHGLANAIVLPHILEISTESAVERLAKLGDLVGTGGDTQADQAKRFVAAVRVLMEKVGIEGQLAALREQDVPAIAKQALAEAYMNYPVPRYLEQPECEVLLRKMLV